MTRRVPSKRKRAELVELCRSRGLSAVKSAQVALKVVQWAIVSESLGHFASGTEYARWTMADERTAWRHRAAIRAVFTEDEFRTIVEQLTRHDVAHLPRSEASRLVVAL